MIYIKLIHITFLDLVFVSNLALITDCSIWPSLAGSDHNAIPFSSLSTLPKSGFYSKVVQNFSKMDLVHLKNLLHLAPWCMVFNEDTVEAMYELYRSFMRAIEAECVPQFTTRAKRRPPWITPEVIALSKQKHKLLRKTKMSGRSASIEIKNIQREIKKKTNLAHRTYVADIAARAMREPKLFWAYVNLQRKSSSPRPSFSHNNETVSDPAATAALFNKHFASMWSSPSPKTAELHDPAAGELDPGDLLPDCLSSITVTEDDLEDAMACLSPFQR